MEGSIYESNADDIFFVLKKKKIGFLFLNNVMDQTSTPSTKIQEGVVLKRTSKLPKAKNEPKLAGPVQVMLLAQVLYTC